jgi:hypothetical protein
MMMMLQGVSCFGTNGCLGGSGSACCCYCVGKCGLAADQRSHLLRNRPHSPAATGRSSREEQPDYLWALAGTFGLGAVLGAVPMRHGSCSSLVNVLILNHVPDRVRAPRAFHFYLGRAGGSRDGQPAPQTALEEGGQAEEAKPEAFKFWEKPTRRRKQQRRGGNES